MANTQSFTGADIKIALNSKEAYLLEGISNIYGGRK